jgi:hypothetical protein
MEARNWTAPTRSHLNALGFASKGAPDSGVYGVDVSSWIGESTWGCIKQNGYTFGQTPHASKHTCPTGALVPLSHPIPFCFGCHSQVSFASSRRIATSTRTVCTPLLMRTSSRYQSCGSSFHRMKPASFVHSCLLSLCSWAAGMVHMDVYLFPSALK